jgi:hypothetical protein
MGVMLIELEVADDGKPLVVADTVAVMGVVPVRFDKLAGIATEHVIDVLVLPLPELQV